MDQTGMRPSAPARAPAPGGRESTKLWLALTAFVLASGFVWAVLRDTNGVAATARQDDPAAQATATREAELAEIATLRAEVSALQTQVAEECAEPTPTIEPTPVPPRPAGQPLDYGDAWTVTVLSATPRPTVGDFTASGTFVEIIVSLTNNANDQRRLPYEDFVLTDEQGRSVAVAIEASVVLGSAQNSFFDAWQTKELHFVFDVLPDAGQRFILESSTDPAFRVEVTLAGRG